MIVTKFHARMYAIPRVGKDSQPHYVERNIRAEELAG